MHDNQLERQALIIALQQAAQNGNDEQFYHAYNEYIKLFGEAPPHNFNQ